MYDHRRPGARLRAQPSRPALGRVLLARRKSRATTWSRRWTRSASRRDARLALHHVPFDPSYALDVRADPSRPVRGDQAGRCERSQGGGSGRRLEGDKGAVAMRIMMNRDISKTPPIPASSGCWRPLRSIRCRSTCCAGGGWSRSGMAARNPTPAGDGPSRDAAAVRPATAGEPWVDLPKVLALGGHHNVVVKISGACTLATRTFPITTSGRR